MGVALNSLTQQPIQHSQFSFGGDDTRLGKSGLFGKIVSWDLHARNDCFKTNFVFLMKKAFAFLDAIGVGTCFFGRSGFTGKIRTCQQYQTGLDRNREARERVVNALGGAAVCGNIPSVTIQANHFTDYLKLGDQYFRSGQSIVQGEDLAGRKFAVMRLSDRSGNTHIATIHQRYRETCIDSSGIYGDGSLWTLNFNSDGQPVAVGTDRVVEFIEKVRTNRHEQFTLAIKP